MPKIRWNNFIAGFFFIAIITSGTFKGFIVSKTAQWINTLLLSLNLDPQRVLQALNYFKKDIFWREDLLGWFLYYPLYFGLHLLFIYFLFFYQKHLRNTLLFCLTGLIILLITCISISKALDWEIFYQIAYDSFK